MTLKIFKLLWEMVVEELKMNNFSTKNNSELLQKFLLVGIDNSGSIITHLNMYKVYFFSLHPNTL